MLKELLEATRLQPDFCASLLGVPTQHLQAWMNGTKALPRYVIPELATVLGVSERQLSIAAPRVGGAEAITPAIWYKLRTTELAESDLQFIGVIRKLGFYIHQLDSATGVKNARAEHVYTRVTTSVNRTEPPAIQGQAAAAVFRDITGIGKTERGLGEVLRKSLRLLGVLIVESPLKGSTIEGCCFEVGPTEDSRPCLFANTYKSTWYRRNAVLAHELGHALLDLDRDLISIDYRKADGPVSDEPERSLEEQRAQAFAQHILVPKSVLVQEANRHGLRWDALAPKDLAQLIADTHAEQRMILKAALEYGFIDDDEFAKYLDVDCGEELRLLSDHALNTPEFLQARSLDAPKWLPENRKVKVGGHTLRLPVGYVVRVLDALNAGQISLGKAAEMLFIDEYVFSQRFPDVAQAHRQ
jgi:Zn-dependent peptidase ImmA (M78 family)